MWFQGINRDDPEKVFRTAQNIYSTADVTAGQALCYDVSTFDGIRVTQPATANLHLMAGIATGTMAQNEYGAIQIGGYCDIALVDGTTGLGAGDPLAVTNGTFNLTLDASEVTGAKGVVPHFAVAGEAYTTGAAAAKAVWLRCI